MDDYDGGAARAELRRASQTMTDQAVTRTRRDGEGQCGDQAPPRRTRVIYGDINGAVILVSDDALRFEVHTVAADVLNDLVIRLGDEHPLTRHVRLFADVPADRIRATAQ